MMRLSKRIDKYAKSEEMILILGEVIHLEATNAALLEALLAAEGAVSFMAQATDADPEDYERQRIVQEAIRKATGCRYTRQGAW